MSADRKKILLADSDERSRRLLGSSLEAQGFEVTGVEGTIDALQALYGSPHDLVVAASVLVDGDGFEILEQIRIDPEMQALPVILITDSEAEEDRARLAGASDVLSRPPRLRVFNRMVESFIGGGGAAEADLPMDTVFRVEYRSFVAQLGKLPGTANAVIRMFDGRRTLAQAIADSEVPDDEARAMIPALIQAEVLVPHSSAPAAARSEALWRTPSALPSAIADNAPVSAEHQALEAAARAAEEEAARAAEAARRAAEEARARAEAARRAAEEEAARRAAEELARVEEELAALDEEALQIQAARAAELEAARQEAEELKRAAEERAAALEAEASRRANELDALQGEVADRRQRATERLSALSGASAAVPAAAAPLAAPAPAPALVATAAAGATLALSGSHVDAVASHLESERRAMEQGGSANETQALIMPAGLPVPSPAPVLPVVSAAAPAAAPVAAPPAEDDFFASAPAAEDDFFGAAVSTPAPVPTNDDLFAEPAREGVPPVVWAVGLLLLVGLIVLLFYPSKDVRDPSPPPASVATTEDTAAPAEPAGADEAAAALAAALGQNAAADEPVAEEGSGDDLAAAAPAMGGGLFGAMDDDEPEDDDAAMAANDGLAAGAQRAQAEREPRADREPRAERAPREARDAAPAPRDRGVADTPTRPQTGGRTGEPATGDAAAALARCNELSSGRDYASTAQACQEAVRLNPRSSDAYAALGKAHYEQDDVRTAINYLEQAVRLNSRNANAILALGAAKQEVGDIAGARQAYERYLEGNPDGRRATEIRSILESL